MTARMIPRITPITIERMVSSIVMTRPRRIGSANMYSQTTAQPKFGLVTTLDANHTASASTMTAETQRQGWRAGIALIGGITSLSFCSSTANRTSPSPRGVYRCRGGRAGGVAQASSPSHPSRTS